MSAVRKPKPVMPELYAESDGRIVLHDIDWPTYEKILHGLGSRRIFATYDRGTLEIMHPLPIHEAFKSWFGLFLLGLAQEIGFPIRNIGAPTLKRKDIERGIEPDTCFYFENAALIRDWRKFDLTRDPPPDLAIEVEVTTSAVSRMGIYASLGIPEVWRFDTETLRVHKLSAGKYVLCPQSPRFPYLPVSELPALMEATYYCLDDIETLQVIRKWVRKHVLPQAQKHAECKKRKDKR